MHPQETKNLFVELRAAGKTFGEIAEQLHVSKSTLHAWAEERADDIARFRRIQWEEWEAEATIRMEDRMENLACHIADYELRLSQFHFGQLSLRDTVMLLRESRREYYRLRGLLMGTGRSSRKSAPNSVEPKNSSASSNLSMESVPPAVTEEPNKTERSHENGATQPRNTNDLQQSQPESFDSVTSAGASSVEPQTSAHDPHSHIPSDSLPPTLPPGSAPAPLSAAPIPPPPDLDAGGSHAAKLLA